MKKQAINTEVITSTGDHDLEVKKLLLEISKLEGEIKLQKRPLMNPANWPPLMSFILWLSAFIWAFFIGKYSLEYTKFEIQKNYLEINNARLNENNFELQRRSDSLLRQIIKLNNSYEKIKHDQLDLSKHKINSN